MARAIHQFLTGFAYGDAISDYAIEIQKLIRKRGNSSEIFCEYLDSRYKDRAYKYPYYFDFRHDDDINIFHYSIGSAIVPFVYEEVHNILLIYHNITPHQYFKFINPHVYKECLSGRRWLGLFKDKALRALADSEFNRKELEEAGYGNTHVVPIVIDYRKFDRNSSAAVYKQFHDSKINWLYVGRVIPNKKIEDLLVAFHAYQKYFNEQSRLVIVGGYKGFERYYYSLTELIEKLRSKDVIFTAHVPTSFLTALFKVSHLFFMLSEHEGFNVPLLEAMYCRIPIIAYNSGAIPSTLKESGVLINEKNPVKIAAMADALLNNKSLKDTIIAQQERVLHEYSQINFENMFMEHLEQAIHDASPTTDKA